MFTDLDSNSMLSLKDWCLILIGAGAGCYASLVASRIIDFLGMKHVVLLRAQLLSAIIDKNSHDFHSGYALDRMLHAQSVEAFSKGHATAANLLKELGDQIETMFTTIRRSEEAWDITKKKGELLQRVADMPMNLSAILFKGPSGRQVVAFYSNKERAYVAQARADTERRGRNVKTYEG